ncbi:MAG: GDSL-type esterase/lipase family protein [Prevotella sp.]|nr:GDSL-type esterase/lipase family protein [Prevotella sp.]
MNPIGKTFVLIGLIVILLLLLHLLPPMSLFGYRLRPVNILSDLFEAPASSDILSESASVDGQQPCITVQKQKKTTDSIADGGQSIETFSDEGKEYLDSFFRKLSEAGGSSRPVRIAYFGDSFIEGDIMTDELREMMQSRWGGEGPGWIDAASEVNRGFRRTIRQSFSGIEAYQVVSKPFDSQRQGLQQRYFIPSEHASVSIAATGAFPHASRWTTADLFFKSPAGITVTARGDDGEAMVRTFEPSDHIRMWHCDKSNRQINYRFTGVGAGAVLYGVALESKCGVILDNYSMRGSSGHSIANIPLSVLQSFARQRPADLIVLHFGLNAVSEQSNRLELENYGRRMQRVIRHLREAFPDVPVLVMSVPDRACRDENGISTMKNIEAMVSVQTDVARKSDAAFFNLFRAMGGKGSMSALTRQGLANKDYTHLNHKGGKIIAGYIFRAFVKSCDSYQRQQSHDHE